MFVIPETKDCRSQPFTASAGEVLLSFQIKCIRTVISQSQIESIDKWKKKTKMVREFMPSTSMFAIMCIFERTRQSLIEKCQTVAYSVCPHFNSFVSDNKRWILGWHGFSCRQKRPVTEKTSSTANWSKISFIVFDILVFFLSWPILAVLFPLVLPKYVDEWWMEIVWVVYSFQRNIDSKFRVSLWLDPHSPRNWYANKYAPYSYTQTSWMAWITAIFQQQQKMCDEKKQRVTD